MTSRELRNQRREAERKAKKLSYQKTRRALSDQSVPESVKPERLDEFTADEPAVLSEAKTQADEQSEMMALRARVHARVGPGPTGPRTPQGKATSSGNSLKHGLASGRIIVPGEDPADFDALLNDLTAEHEPATETEQLLVRQMAQSWWLMQRAIRIQNQAFTETRVDTQKLALFLRYQTTHERAFYKALNTLIKLQNQRRKSAPEFVSQKTPQPAAPAGFVSQNAANGASRVGTMGVGAVACPAQTESCPTKS